FYQPMGAHAESNLEVPAMVGAVERGISHGCAFRVVMAMKDLLDEAPGYPPNWRPVDEGRDDLELRRARASPGSYRIRSIRAAWGAWAVPSMWKSTTTGRWSDVRRASAECTTRACRIRIGPRMNALSSDPSAKEAGNERNR